MLRGRERQMGVLRCTAAGLRAGGQGQAQAMGSKVRVGGMRTCFASSVCQPCTTPHLGSRQGCDDEQGSVRRRTRQQHPAGAAAAAAAGAAAAAAPAYGCSSEGVSRALEGDDVRTLGPTMAISARSATRAATWGVANVPSRVWPLPARAGGSDIRSEVADWALGRQANSLPARRQPRTAAWGHVMACGRRRRHPLL